MHTHQFVNPSTLETYPLSTLPESAFATGSRGEIEEDKLTTDNRLLDCHQHSIDANQGWYYTVGGESYHYVKG